VFIPNPCDPRVTVRPEPGEHATEELNEYLGNMAGIGRGDREVMDHSREPLLAESTGVRGAVSLRMTGSTSVARSSIERAVSAKGSPPSPICARNRSWPSSSCSHMILSMISWGLPANSAPRGDAQWSNASRGKSCPRAPGMLFPM
jgi:hypothetical protein